MPIQIIMKRDADHEEAVSMGAVKRYEALMVSADETGLGEISHVIGHDSLNIRCSHNSTRAVALEGKEHILNACTAFALISTLESLVPDPQPGEIWELFGHGRDGSLLRKEVQIISCGNHQILDEAGFFQPLVKCSNNDKEIFLSLLAFFSARKLF